MQQKGAETRQKATHLLRSIRLGPCGSFRLVSNHNVGEREELLELQLEELRDERCAQVERDRLARECCLFRKDERRLEPVCEEVAFDIEVRRSLDESFDCRGGEMRFVELLRGAEGGYE
jgi:hypothetical protein